MKVVRCAAMLRARLLVAGIGVMAACTPAAAYEDDVHYGLTRWLARMAGFSPEDAETIAQADVGYDGSGLNAVELVYHAACRPFAKDKQVAEEVQRIHFPGEGPLPSLPAQRVVTQGSAAAYSELNAVLAVPTDTPAHRLLKLGKSLHPLQDSWSHQGKSDSPLDPVCDARYSWGHPQARGGWRSHKADLSHKDLGSAVKMAGATYQALCDYRAKALKSECTRPFEDLSAEVTSLLEKNTKAAKATWFKAHGFTESKELMFLYATNVEDGGLSVGKHEPTSYAGKALTAVQNSKEGALPATEEAAFMRAFFKAWTTRDDLATVVKEWIALGSYRLQLARAEVRPVEAIAAEAQLRFWRVRDHGSLEQPMEGHELITRRYTSVPDLILKGERRYGSLDEALLPLDQTGLPIVTWITPRADGAILLVGAARFRHAPNDLVIVVAEKVDGIYKVVSIDSVVTK